MPESNTNAAAEHGSIGEPREFMPGNRFAENLASQ